MMISHTQQTYAILQYTHCFAPWRALAEPESGLNHNHDVRLVSYCVHAEVVASTEGVFGCTVRHVVGS